MITKDQIKGLLRKPNTNFTFAKTKVVDYLLQAHIKPLVINNIVDQAVKKKIHKLSSNKIKPNMLFRFFYNTTADIIKGTPYGGTPYRSQQFIKTIWADDRLQQFVINYLRKNGFTKMELPEEMKAKLEKLDKQKKAEARAYKMRVGRAKKRAEKLNAKSTDGTKYEVIGDKVVELHKEPEQGKQEAVKQDSPKQKPQQKTTTDKKVAETPIDPNKIPDKYKKMNKKYETKVKAAKVDNSSKGKKELSREDQERLRMIKGL